MEDVWGRGETTSDVAFFLETCCFQSNAGVAIAHTKTLVTDAAVTLCVFISLCLLGCEECDAKAQMCLWSRVCLHKITGR